MEVVRCSLVESVSAKDMMERVLKLELKTQMTVIILLWLWWDERNKIREEGRRRTAVEVAYVVAALTDRFQTSASKGLLSESRQTHHWSKPQRGKLR